MSAPPPVIVQTPVLLLYDWPPAGRGPPMSAQYHKVGQDAATAAAVPICRHGMDSLRLGEQVPGSTPPVSSTCVLSATVVATPPMVKVIFGATLIGVQTLG